jgi:hypothetical protein
MFLKYSQRQAVRRCPTFVEAGDGVAYVGEVWLVPQGIAQAARAHARVPAAKQQQQQQQSPANVRWQCSSAVLDASAFTL